MLPRRHTLHIGLLSSSAAVSSSWIAKVISTVFALSPPPHAAARLSPLRAALTPLVAAEALFRLRDPHLALAFLSLTASAFRVRHLPEAFLSVSYALCHVGRRDAALKLLDEMLTGGYAPDSALLELLVGSHASAGDLNTALGLIHTANDHAVTLSPSCCNDIMEQLVATGRARDALRFFFCSLGSPHFIPDTCSFNIAIKGLCELGAVKRALDLFHDMSGYNCPPDTITYNIIIDGLCKSDQVDAGGEMLAGLLQRGPLSPPSVVTFTSLIRGYCKKGDMQEAYGLFRGMLNYGIQPNVVTYNVMIDGYGKAGDMAMASSMYDELMVSGHLPDRVTYTSLIEGFCRNGRVDDAFRFWHVMKERNILPNAYSFAIFINALCKQNRLSEARSFLVEMTERRDILPRAFMFNPIVDGLCKTGNIDDAKAILAQMEDCRCSPDKITYTIMMIGSCMKGRILEAICLFSKMMVTGCTPDNITIQSFVSCLLKGGKPNEAYRIIAAFGKDRIWARG